MTPGVAPERLNLLCREDEYQLGLQAEEEAEAANSAITVSEGATVLQATFSLASLLCFSVPVAFIISSVSFIALKWPDSSRDMANYADCFSPSSAALIGSSRLVPGLLPSIMSAYCTAGQHLHGAGAALNAICNEGGWLAWGCGPGSFDSCLLLVCKAPDPCLQQPSARHATHLCQSGCITYNTCIGSVQDRVCSIKAQA